MGAYAMYIEDLNDMKGDDRYSVDMALPAGCECGQCAHYGWCSDMHGIKKTNTFCHFSPSRFGKVIPVVNSD